MDLITKLGTALYETHGALCEEVINAGYELDDHTNSGKGWGDFRKMFIKLALARGAKSYYDYEVIFNKVKTPDDELASPQLFARVSGIKAKPIHQTERTRRYRQNQSNELKEARGLLWINENPEQAIEYIKKHYPNLL